MVETPLVVTVSVVQLLLAVVGPVSVHALRPVGAKEPLAPVTVAV